MLTENDTQSVNKDLNFEKRGKVLVIEDDKISLQVAKQMLSHYHETIETANTGQAAIALAENTKYDLIYLDIGLPDLSGIDVVKHIRQKEGLNQRTPIIALTGHLAQTYWVQCEEAGVDYMITKPLMRKNIHTVLSKFF